MIKIKYAITGYLYNNDKLLLRGMWEDLVDFIEELKEFSSLYHLAGDSLVTTVMMAIFGELFNIDWQNKLTK